VSFGPADSVIVRTGVGQALGASSGCRRVSHWAGEAALDWSRGFQVLRGAKYMLT